MGQGRRLRLVLTGRAGFVLTHLAAFLSTGGHLVHVFPTSEDVRIGPTQAVWGPTAVPDFAALEQADAVLHIGVHALPQLLRTLDERRSRARTVIALPTVAGSDQPAGDASELAAIVNGSPRRVVALLTPGVLVAVAGTRRHGAGRIGHPVGRWRARQPRRSRSARCTSLRPMTAYAVCSR